MLAGIGFVVAIVGLAVEFVAVVGATFYPVRRRLPLGPFELQSIGFLLFLAGPLSMLLPWLILQAVDHCCDKLL